MMSHFKIARCWRYEDRTHAVKVLKTTATDLKKLWRLPSFECIEQKLLPAL